MRIATRLGTVGLLVGGLSLACGARTGLFVGVGIGGEEPCTHPIPILKAVPNLYFVLDHSGSMKDDNKWTTMRDVLGNLMSTLGPDGNFGATMFPSDSLCAPGTEILPLTKGDTQGTAAAAFLNATTVAPVGGTPTAATLTALKPELEGFAGSTFVILATDGGANCDPNAVCDVDTCTANLDGVTITQKTDAGTAAVVCQPLTPPNCCVPPPLGAGNLDCLDTQATTAAVAALKAAGIPVYVVGILGSAPYETMLDGLAQAGGTARATAPYYYRVDTADAQALTTALSEIAAKITASCTVTLAGAPNDLASVTVSLGGKALAQDPTNGWTITGTTLSLNGSSCQELLSGQKFGLAVADGCN